MGFEVALEYGGVVPGQQDAGCARRHDDRAVHGRVQRLEVFDAHVGQLGGQLDVDVTRDQHGLEVGVVFDQRQLGAVTLRVGHDVFHRL